MKKIVIIRSVPRTRKLPKHLEELFRREREHTRRFIAKAGLPDAFYERPRRRPGNPSDSTFKNVTSIDDSN